MNTIYLSKIIDECNSNENQAVDLYETISTFLRKNEEVVIDSKDCIPTAIFLIKLYNSLLTEFSLDIVRNLITWKDRDDGLSLKEVINVALTSSHAYLTNPDHKMRVDNALDPNRRHKKETP